MLDESGTSESPDLKLRSMVKPADDSRTITQEVTDHLTLRDSLGFKPNIRRSSALDLMEVISEDGF